MKIVAGLGNPGSQYADTPHSVGFETVDRIAADVGAAWEEKRAFRCLMARCVVAGQPVILVKPQTFMNLSGESIAPVVKYHNATSADLEDRSDVIGHVLGKFDPETRKAMNGIVARAVDAVESVLRDGPDKAMNAFNSSTSRKGEMQ